MHGLIMRERFGDAAADVQARSWKLWDRGSMHGHARAGLVQEAKGVPADDSLRMVPRGKRF
jgi:hypothetical protein